MSVSISAGSSWISWCCTPLNLVFIYIFYRISISRAHCYVVLTLFSLISAPNNKLQLLVENQQFLSSIRKSVGVKEARHAIYIIPHQSRDLSSNIRQNNLLPPRPDKHITLLLDLSKPVREIFPLWVSVLQNLQNAFGVVFAMKGSIWEVWYKVKRWQIIWTQTQLWKVTVKRRKESKPHRLTS